jgi:hypothetical protein
VAPGVDVDLCAIDPGFDVDLYVTTDLRTITAMWMGLSKVREALTAKENGADRRPAACGGHGLSPFAAEKKLATA